MTGNTQLTKDLYKIFKKLVHTSEKRASQRRTPNGCKHKIVFNLIGNKGNNKF